MFSFECEVLLLDPPLRAMLLLLAAGKAVVLPDVQATSLKNTRASWTVEMGLFSVLVNPGSAQYRKEPLAFLPKKKKKTQK